MHDIHVDISLKIREKKSGSTEFWNVTEDGGQILTSIFFFLLSTLQYDNSLSSSLCGKALV